MGRKPFSRQHLIDALERLAERLGRTPRRCDTHDYSDIPAYMVYLNRFGSWRAALEEAGIPLDPRNTGYDRKTLLDHLRKLAETLGRTPVYSDLEKVDGPCGTTYRSHFGSWSAAVAEAGLEVEPRSRRYDKDELLHMLRELADELGRAPNEADLSEREDLPSPSTYKYRFGGWNDALREAGLTLRQIMNCSGDAGNS